MAHPASQQLGQHLEELSRRLRPDSETPAPDRVVTVAVAAVPGARHGGLTVVTGSGRPRTWGATSTVATDADRLQYELHEGSCLEAAARDDIVRSDDLQSETRWSGFGPACAERLGVRSMLCVRLRLTGTDRAAMNFYAEEPAAFDADAEAVATLFAPFAAMALQGEIDSDRAAQLATALESSRRIGTAIGIIMARELLTEEQAFQRLVHVSQHLNVKLRDVAERVRETGTVP